MVTASRTLSGSSYSCLTVSQVLHYPYSPHREDVMDCAHNSAGVSIPSWSSLGSAEDGTSHLGSTASFNFLKSCLKECVENTTNTHEACIQALETPLPKRVLSVRPQDVKICVKDGEFGRYCALSYRWGTPDQVYKTTRANFSRMMENIDWDLLPRLIQDAITVTRELDIDYLWIDALCIIQEDEEDWLSESAKMGQYYTNAFLTIAASSSPGVQTPFLGPRMIPDETSRLQSLPKLKEFRFCDTGGTTTTIIGRRVPDYAGITLTGTTLLATRGWAWQENALSVRIVHYTSRELIWECRYCQIFENGARLRHSDTSLTYRFAAACQGQPEKAHGQLEYYWKTLVMEFSNRQLTYESDRLTAISGVAAEIRKSLVSTSASPSTDNQYLVGLWRQWLESDLMWRTFWPNPSTPPVVSRASTLPSWSWLSIFCAVSFEYVLLDKLSVRKTKRRPLDITHVVCEPLHGACPFGNVQAGASITLTGYLFSAALSSRNTSQSSSYRLVFDDSNHGMDPDTVLEGMDIAGPDGAVLERTAQRRVGPASATEEPDVLDATVYCLFIAGGWYNENVHSSWITHMAQESFYLVLGRTKSSLTSTGMGNVFTRVGSLRSDNRKIPKAGKLHEIVLV
jgi:Heterokaryon incompatibility protein (HET)